jgi:predicted GNAT family acetyltransferase
VLVALLSEDTAKDKLKRKFLAKDFDLMNLNKTDLEDVSFSDLDENDEGLPSSSSDDNDKDVTAQSMKNRQIVAYLIYTKHKDELETVTLRDVCVDTDYRKRGVAKCFVKKACLNVFKNNGYRRVTFNVSNFHSETKHVCEKKSNYVHKIYSWVAFFFIIGVCDERNVYSFNIDQVSKI